MKRLLIFFIVLFSINTFAEEAKDILIIDVRSTEEFNSGHLDGAIHIPYQEIGEKIAAHAKSKDNKIVLYCAKGGRAGKALKTLQELGYTKAENGGGYKDMKKRFAPPILTEPL